MSLSQESGSRQVPELQQNLAILKEVAFFNGFPQEVLKLLAYLCVRGDYESGDTLLEKGDDPGLALCILSGTAALYREGKNGFEKLRTYSEGEFLGGLTLLGPMTALFSLKAETKIKVLILTREQFSKVLEKHPELNPLLRKAVLQQLRRWEQTNVDELESCCLRKVGVTLL